MTIRLADCRFDFSLIRLCSSLFIRSFILGDCEIQKYNLYACNWLVCVYNSTCASLKLFVALMHDHIVTVMHGLLSVFMVL